MEEKELGKKRICIFSLAYFPFVGGAEIAMKEITDRLPQYEFDLITLRFDSTLPPIERKGNVTVHRIGFTKRSPYPKDLVSFPLYLNKIFFPLTAFLKARSLHKKRKYDALWPMLLYAALPAYFFSLCNSRVPYVLTIQDGDTPKHLLSRIRIKPFLFLLRRAVSRAAIVQTISEHLAGLAKTLGAKETAVVPNGVDLSLFKRSLKQKERDAERAKWGIGEDDIVIITHGRLVQKNGVADIIRSLSNLPSHIKFLAVGGGPLKENLLQTARTLFLGDRVIFTGEKSHKDTVRLLECADIFCRPSLSEGLGNSFLEAMAMNLPVIGTRVDGIRDFLFPEKTGWECEPRNPQSIARAVEEIIDPENRKKTMAIIKEARRMVEEKYDWNIIAHDMDEIFGGVIEKEYEN